MKSALALALCSAALLAGAAEATTYSFIAFFDFGGTEVSVYAQKTIAQFSAFCSGMDRRVTLHAHTDSAEASDALARSRGEAVRVRLVALGISADRIAVVSHGADRLLVPTPLNTREPQNRRVEQVCN
jgi:OOP family OmpA-OmpF porin